MPTEEERAPDGTAAELPIDNSRAEDPGGSQRDLDLWNMDLDLTRARAVLEETLGRMHAQRRERELTFAQVRTVTNQSLQEPVAAESSTTRTCVDCYRQFRTGTISRTRACLVCPMCATCVREYDHRHCQDCQQGFSARHNWMCTSCLRAGCCASECQIRGCQTRLCDSCCDGGNHRGLFIQDSSSREYPPRQPEPPPYEKFLYLGVELEVVIEDRGVDEAAERITEALPNKFLLKYDGSVNEGFECVTGPMSLEKHQEFWPAVVPTLLKNGARSWEHTSTGLHVHVSRNWFSPLTTGKLGVFINSEKTRKQILRLAGRESPNYALLAKKKLTQVGARRSWEAYMWISSSTNRWALSDINRFGGEWVNLGTGSSPLAALNHWTRRSDVAAYTEMDVANFVKAGSIRRTTITQPFDGRRYEALNLMNRDTLEFRLFKGTLKLQHILADVEFCHAAANWVSQASIRDVESWPSFWGWVLAQGKISATTEVISELAPKPKQRSRHPYEHLILQLARETNHDEEVA